MACWGNGSICSREGYTFSTSAAPCRAICLLRCLYHALMMVGWNIYCLFDGMRLDCRFKYLKPPVFCLYLGMNLWKIHVEIHLLCVNEYGLVQEAPQILLQYECSRNARMLHQIWLIFWQIAAWKWMHWNNSDSVPWLEDWINGHKEQKQHSGVQFDLNILFRNLHVGSFHTLQWTCNNDDIGGHHMPHLFSVWNNFTDPLL